jgi:hypothetical protein
MRGLSPKKVLRCLGLDKSYMPIKSAATPHPTRPMQVWVGLVGPVCGFVLIYYYFFFISFSFYNFLKNDQIFEICSNFKS